MTGCLQYKSRTLGIVAISVVLPFAVYAQCSDGTTSHLAVHHLIRESSNSVDALAGTQTVGDYWETWTSYVSATESVNSGLLHFSSNGPSGYGGIASIEWHDAPSSAGAGTYSMSNSHRATSQCGDDTTYPSSDSLLVRQPTITGTTGAWFLGGGSDAANGYYNAAAVTANANCGPGDTCNNTPYWTVLANPTKVTLSCSVCTSNTVTAAEPSDAVGDIQLRIDIGGFSSAPFSFTVNAPGSLESAGVPYDIGYNDGYFSAIYYYTQDEFGGRMTSIALNEKFTSPPCAAPVGNFCPNQANNWNKSIPYGISGYSAGYWYDRIYFSQCSNCQPAYSAPQNPLSGSSVDYSIQTWRIGSATVGMGVDVQSDTFQRYVDHGRHNDVVSPLH